MDLNGGQKVVPTVRLSEEMGGSKWFALCHCQAELRVYGKETLVLYHVRLITFTFTYSITTRVIWAPQLTSHDQFPPFFSVLHCPLGLGSQAHTLGINGVRVYFFHSCHEVRR